MNRPNSITTIAANAQAVNQSTLYVLDTSAGAVTLQLSPIPFDGDTFWAVNDPSFANPGLVDGNGKNITSFNGSGGTFDLQALNILGVPYRFIFNASDDKWYAMLG